MSVQSNLELAVGQLNALVAPVQQALTDLPAELQAKYDEGFLAGKADESEPDDTIFTQADLDNAVASAKAPLEATITQLNESVALMQTQIAELQGSVESQVKAAREQLVSEIEASFQESQTSENEAEGKFAQMLASLKAPAEPQPEQPQS